MKISGCTNNLKRTIFNAHNKDNTLYKFMLTSVNMHIQIHEEQCLFKTSIIYNQMKTYLATWRNFSVAFSIISQYFHASA